MCYCFAYSNILRSVYSHIAGIVPCLYFHLTETIRGKEEGERTGIH
jgi:hypothetical protein